VADKTSIEWTDATWNPTTGCSIVSPGCTNCYAMKVANGLERRFDSPKYRGLTKVVNGNAVWTGEVRLDEAALLQPLKWKKGRRIFVNSMSDLFHEALTDSDIDRVFAVMALCPQHTFQVLTKRAERMRNYMTLVRAKMGGTPLGAYECIYNAMGRLVSAERQQEADERIPLLLDTPAAVRFVSAEPLLGPINLTRLCVLPQKPGSIRAGIHVDALRNKHCESQVKRGLGPLDWVIVGGESGPKARPMHPQWARDIRDQCEVAGVSFFFKQWGEWSGPVDAINVSRTHALCGLMGSEPHVVRDWVPALEFFKNSKGVSGCAVVARIGKSNAGRVLDGATHDAFPEVRG
jgi:protein gp37